MSDEKPTKVRANDHESYNTLSILSFLIPAAGFILGIVYLTRDEKVDRKLGEHLIAVSVLGGILFWILWTFYLSSQFQTVPYYY